jgi:hypothetical protein
MSVFLEPFGLRLHGQCHVGVGPLVGGVCAFLVGLSDAEGLVADRRRALPLDRAGRGRGLYAGPALRAGRVPVREDWRPAAMLFLNQRTKLKEDAIIGLIFTSFFGLGLFMISLSPASVNIQTIVLGNILAITPGGHAATRHHRRRQRWRSWLAQVEGPDGRVLRREPRAHDRPPTRTWLKSAVLHACCRHRRWLLCRRSAPSSWSPWW